MTEFLERDAKSFCAFIANKGEELLNIRLDGEVFVTAGVKLGILKRKDQSPAGSNET